MEKEDGMQGWETGNTGLSKSLTKIICILAKTLY